MKKTTVKKKATKKKAVKKVTSPKTPKTSKNKMSLLDAAAKVLEKESPLTCRQIVDRIAEAKLWKTDTGKTPANTLHAALSKEIRIKGKEARFEKVDRGQFALKANK